MLGTNSGVCGFVLSGASRVLSDQVDQILWPKFLACIAVNEGDDPHDAEVAHPMLFFIPRPDYELVPLQYYSVVNQSRYSKRPATLKGAGSEDPARFLVSRSQAPFLRG
jgi:hypothetical protein